MKIYNNFESLVAAPSLNFSIFDFLLTATMSDPVWDYYVKDTKRYKTDTVHWGAWCSACLNKAVDLQHNEETESFSSNPESAPFPRDKDAIHESSA